MRAADGAGLDLVGIQDHPYQRRFLDRSTGRQTRRDPGSIWRILNVQGLIGAGPPPPRSSLPVGYLAGEPLTGPPDWWVGTLAGFVANGFDTLVFWPVDTDPVQVELLAADVVPHLRASG